MMNSKQQERISELAHIIQAYKQINVRSRTEKYFKKKEKGIKKFKQKTPECQLSVPNKNNNNHHNNNHNNK